MSANRDVNLKIPDIKALRSLSRLLGKLHIYFAVRNPPPPHPYGYSNNYPEWSYGIGLAEAKFYVENKYNYIHVKNSPYDQFSQGNIIHEIKRTRQLMNILNRLGLVSPDAGLRVCKEFVTRQRN